VLKITHFIQLNSNEIEKNDSSSRHQHFLAPAPIIRNYLGSGSTVLIATPQERQSAEYENSVTPDGKWFDCKGRRLDFAPLLEHVAPGYRHTSYWAPTLLIC